jgi:hypothetical protein
MSRSKTEMQKASPQRRHLAAELAFQADSTSGNFIHSHVELKLDTIPSGRRGVAKLIILIQN